MGSTAKLVSWLFLPLYAPVFALMIALYLESYQPGMFQNETAYSLAPETKSSLLYIFAVLSIAFPGASILFFRFSGTIKTLLMEDRRERILPAIFTNGAALVLYFLLLKMDPNKLLPRAIPALSLGSCITVLLCTFITLRWKISLHAAGMGILTGFLFAYYASQIIYPFWLLPMVLVVSGLVMSARIFLQSHTLAQCLSGFLLGGVSVATCVLLY